MKNILKSKLSKAGLLITSTFACASAFATTALPSGITEAFAKFTTQISELETLAWPILISVTSAFVIIKLFKRFVSKAT
ncbi:major coat protein [Pseudoalteromonas rubra]|uniref:major coat protein n=1 Tax=Pseudoalteromonas rubra TaxID=43658 RepID=UPI0013EE525B|nr:major coat protein [Pseudoalteromonas rubra]